MNSLYHTNNTKTFCSYSPLFALAPMDGYTDIATRLITYKYSPEIKLFFTEFINVQGLFAKPKIHLENLMYPSTKLNPLKFKKFPCTIAQVFGNVEQIEYFKLASTAIYLLGLKGIDLNMGCPAKNILKHGSGASLIGHKNSVRQIIDSILTGIYDAHKLIKSGDTLLWLKERFNLSDNDLKIFNLRLNFKPDEIFTVSIKTRLGIDKLMPDDWWLFLDSLSLDFITVHARTVSQGYSGSAELKNLVKLKDLLAHTPLIGNGDILRTYSIKDALNFTPFGIMIGRALMGKPYLLHEFLSLGADIKDLSKIIEKNKDKAEDIKIKHFKLAQMFLPKYKYNPKIFLKFRY